MNLFRKSTISEPEQDKGVMGEVKPYVIQENLSAEENVRRWFQQQFGQEMPEEIRRLFRKTAQAEINRLKASEHVMNPNELKRIHEQIRLQQSKLTNITQTINGLQTQKEWVHKFKELKSTQEKFRQVYFEKNKKYNEHLHEMKELERFETFEDVQNNYQRIKAKEGFLQFVRQEVSQHAQATKNANETFKEIQEQSEQEEKKYKEKRNHLHQIQDTLAQGYKLQAQISIYDTELNELNHYKEEVEREMESIKTERHNTEEELKKFSEQKTGLQQQLQSLESQQNMLDKGEVVLSKLNFLQSLVNRKDGIQKAVEQTHKSQQEQNEKLNILFLTSQDLDAQINALQGELHIHQKSILGMSSYQLQQRAIDLKSQKEMLTNAIHLWKQISDGYALVDDKSQEIMRMKQHNETLKRQISDLEAQTEGMQKQCEELKYAYTLSKSQDVMYLRKDLQEGVSCSVCGATHHPFHSDTMLDQSKLIGDMKRDFEQAETDLKHKMDALTELVKEQATEAGKIEIAFEALTIYKKTLEENVLQWEKFASIDHSFKDCSSSTNFDGRRVMLQQLMEKTTIDAEKSKEELDSYNFHQTSINNLNERLVLKKQEKNDLITRINEVNTGCQVLASRLEHLQQSLARANNNLHKLYEEMDGMIPISGWYKDWLENPETLNIYLLQQTKRWNELKKETATIQSEWEKLQTKHEQLDRQTTSLSKQYNHIIEKLEQTNEYKKHAQEILQKLFPNSDVERYDKDSLTSLTTQENTRDDNALKATEARVIVAQCNGYDQCLTDITRMLEERIAEERSELDLWIKKYNSVHSPVQFSELEHTFNSDTDWNTLRKTVRTVTVDHLVAEARSEEARLALAAHQVSALSFGNDTEDRTAALNIEIAKLERERSNILVEIAKLQAQVEKHELGIQKMAFDQDRYPL